MQTKGIAPCQMGLSKETRQVRQNKLTPYLDSDPYIVAVVQGSKVTAVKQGKKITGNANFFKKIQCGRKESDDEEDPMPPRNAAMLLPESTPSQNENENTQEQGSRARFPMRVSRGIKLLHYRLHEQNSTGIVLLTRQR